MTWEELLANPVQRDAHGVLIVLEEVDEDARVAWYRRGGETFELRATETALALQVLDGEVVDADELAAPAPVRARLVAAGVAAAGLALLAARRRR